MPAYKSLGISATLLVTNLDQTLSDEINLRMGKSLQQDTKRIQDQLNNGRALQEQPTGPENSKVGVFQFLGENEDMVLLMVAASDGQGSEEYIIVEDVDAAEGERPENTNAVPTSTTPPPPTPTQTASGRKSKRVANNQLKRSKGGKRREQLTEAPSTTVDQVVAPTAQSGKTQKRSKIHHNPITEQLALCLNVDFTKFYEKEKTDAPLLHGKDLKLEVFINGQLVGVTFESSRKRTSGLVQYSGTRFHRQAEKPWVYVPTAAITSGDVDSTSDQRWDNIGEALGQEAEMRGINTWGQHPISAQFLASLARSQLPKSVKTRSQHFAVVDLVITAGRGRKFGPDTTYLDEPTRLADKQFSGLNLLTEGQVPVSVQDANFALQADSQMFGDFTNFQPSELTGEMFKMPSEQLHAPATPRTPKTMDMQTSQRLRQLLDTTPMKKLLSTYENAKGHVKGKRTLRQRFGDMSKMSPRKQLEVLDHMKEDLDEDTMNAIMAAFEQDFPTSATSEQKKVRFSFGEDVPPAPMFGENMKVPFSFGGGVAPALTFGENMKVPFSFGEDVFAPAPTFNETFQTQTLATSAYPSTLTPAQMNPYLLGHDLFGSYPQLHPTIASDANTDLFHAEGTVNPADLAPLNKIKKMTPASALSGSPTSTPVKYHHSHHKYDATMGMMDPFVDHQPMFGLPSQYTPPPVTPQQVPTSSNQNSRKKIAAEQTPGRALANFQVPDLFKKSTVSYADGRKQRQAIKIRGGEFEEQQFVVGMRFIVL